MTYNIEMRLLEIDALDGLRNDPTIKSVEAKTTGKKPQILHMMIDGARGDAQATFTDVGTTINDIETSYPTDLSYASADAADDVAGTGLRTFAVIAVDIDNKIVLDSYDMHGTTNTVMGKNYRDILYMYGTAFGSGGVAAGQIQIGSATTTNVYNAILLGAKHGQKCSIRMFSGMNIKRLYEKIVNTTFTALGDGTICQAASTGLGLGHTTPLKAMAYSDGAKDTTDFHEFKGGATITIQAKIIGNGEGHTIHFDFLIWYD